MKKFLTAISLALITVASAHAASNVGQCVFPNSKTAKNGGLEFKKPVYIYAMPSETADKTQLTSLTAYTIAKESNSFIQLKETPGFADVNPNAGKIRGWAKLSDFRFQDLRNCN